MHAPPPDRDMRPAMAQLPGSVLDAVDAGARPWPGPLSPAQRQELAALLGPLGEEAWTRLLGALLDPERNGWGRAALQALHHLGPRGGRLTGFVSDEVLEFADDRGERFGVIPLAFALPSHPGGDEADVARMLSTLDGVFGARSYALWVRRALPPTVDVEPVRRAVHLWLSALDRGDRTESHAVYEDDDIALDLTLLGPRAGSSRVPGRVVTVMPLPSLERLASVDARVVEAAARAEETAGDLPLVCVAAADRSWRVSRGYLQQLLYGTADRVDTTVDGDRRTYEAEFTATGRSMFSDPACRQVSEVVWIEGGGGGPLSFSTFTLQNPWAAVAPGLRSGPRTFAVAGEPRGLRAVLRWEAQSS